MDEIENLMLSAASGQLDAPTIAACLLAHSASGSFRLWTHRGEAWTGVAAPA